MSEYLLAREKDELLRAEKRSLPMPDGSRRDVTAFNVIWRWYDRGLAYAYGLKEDTFLKEVVEINEYSGQTFDEDFAFSIDCIVKYWDEEGIDPTETDADLWIAAAKKASTRFYERKRQGKENSDGT